ncbi:MAG: hypothetical protein K0U98_22870 [Deltaproteobacteria bacterium]|nr:hypothetical protein [Deltaproteobacteria bacterium]
MHHEPITVPTASVTLPEGNSWGRLSRISAVVGVVALLATFALYFKDGHTFFPSYLVAFLFWLSIALGGLIFVLIQYATRAGWSVAVRRLAEHVMGTLPVFGLLFLPLLLGIHDLYHWSHHEAVEADRLLEHKSAFLNSFGFSTRSVVYLVIWSLLAWWFRRQSIAQDQSKDPQVTRRLQARSAPAILVFALTVTFASFDWIMSLDPHWYSTVFGVYLFAGCFLAIHAVLALLCLRLQNQKLLAGVVSFEHYHDLGKMLFAMVVFWAYIGFSQYMLIWYANIPEETAFFQERLTHGWKGITVALVLGHFVLPFLFLLLRGVKRRRATLRFAALWLLAVHWLDLYWLVMPPLNHDGPHFSFADVTAFVGIGGLFLAVLATLMQKSALVPIGDPRLTESLSFENV